MMTYVDGKAAGAVNLTKVGFETYQLVAKRFDNSTGQETYPELVTINRKSVEEAKIAAQKQLDEATKRIAGIAQLEKDLAALDTTV